MAIVTTQVINRYYEEYKSTVVTFSKEILHTLKMDPRQISLKIGGDQWPCVMYSTSFTQAKIILGKQSEAYPHVGKEKPDPVSIRFSFYQDDGQLLSFSVVARVQLVEAYMNSDDLVIVSLLYTQRPPDDLIIRIGTLLDANANAIRRKEERIPITQDSLRKLNISKKEAIALVQNIPRHCFLQDLSFGGAKIVLQGLAQFLVNKDVVLQIDFEDPHETVYLKGTIVGASFIEGRKDILVGSIKFDETAVPIVYKLRINAFITSQRKTALANGNAAEITGPDPDNKKPSLFQERAKKVKEAQAEQKAIAVAAEVNKKLAVLIEKQNSGSEN